MNTSEQARRITRDRMAGALSDLCLLVQRRVPAQADLVARHAALCESTEAAHQQAKDELAERRQRDKTAVQTEYAALRRDILTRYKTQEQATEREYQRVRAEIIGRFEAKKAAAEQARTQTEWEASAILEATESQAAADLEEAKKRVDARAGDLVNVHREAVQLLLRQRQWREDAAFEPTVGSSPRGPVAYLDELIARARGQLDALRGLSLPRFFEGGQPVGYFLLVTLMLVVPTALVAGMSGWPWVLASGVGAVIAYGAVATCLYRAARRQTSEIYSALKATVAELGVVQRQAHEAVLAEHQRRLAQARARCRGEIERADAKCKALTAEIGARQEEELARADDKYPPRLSQIAADRDRELAEAETVCRQRMHCIVQQFEEDSQRIEREFGEKAAENRRQHERDWNELADAWHSGIGRFQGAIDEVERYCAPRFPDWDREDWDRRPAPTETPAGFRIGHFAIHLDQIEGGTPDDERLKPRQIEFALPALLPFPERSLLLLKSSSRGREQGIRLIQSVMLRMLTSMPPGKVRFTIIDPVGLGENFSAFMHLADYQEQLINSRIWTDPGHIDQRLGDLTDHMENVIQVYLRNEFETIQQYNDFAGDMAEAYRVLVVADFPTGFTQASAQKLKSIVTSGARCGVFTLLAVPGKSTMPQDFDLADLAPHALWLNWRGEEFVDKHPDYGTLSLRFDEPPGADRFTRIVRAVGAQVRDAGRVEVPFECVAPARDRWWAGDSRRGLDVALGRAGAKKLQHLTLGSGTSHHVLIAGKTGSGKSNLMHALILNVGLHYSPDEVELYLIDFKKGVEFKPYGTGMLPHARVVAIESEREFGLSVLARLDEELRRRGDLFRAASVQDLAGYRSSRPEAKLPRILLIIDEFQELFVEDDRIAQDSALYLDRLVRQGRAFGIHVLLGSQTLAGAYSLARSTIGQMAVRIALQCSEADAHLILSEENTAARLLNRPGEAIYNDANGLFEGNHPFQVVWLPDRQRDAYLHEIDEFKRRRRCVATPPIVFEGNAPADPGANPLLAELLDASSWPEGQGVFPAWLGAPVAIKSPTAAEFVRQGASNLLIVGHQEDAAQGVLAACLISLAAQHPPVRADNGSAGARFYVFDGMRPDAPTAGLWTRMAAALPHEIEVVPPRHAAAFIAQIAEELARRKEEDRADAPPVYLVVNHLGRFRDLRKSDDDFGYSSFGEPKQAGPGDLFAGVLREGPEFGIHGLLWCDTCNNLMRSLDRQTLRDLEMRVLFQMNPADSSSLIDTPAAGRLGPFRAVFYDEGQGRLEKFRPYAVPSEAWLQWIGQQLHGRIGKAAEAERA